MPWIDVPQVSGAQRATAARARADGDRGWYRISNAAAPDEATLYLYDEVGGWFGATADQFVSDLSTVTSPNLRVHVNSPGGSVFEGLAIANALRAHPSNVVVQVDGLAASIASVIAMAGDRVEMAPNAMLMVHEASGLCLGDAAEMEKMAEVLDLISENIAGAYQAKAGGSVDDWRATMKAETWYLADDAVKAGLADVALPAGAAPAPDEDDPEMRAQFDLAAYGYAGPKKPAPKPGPPPAKTDPAAASPEPALVISIADVLDQEAVAALRAAVTAPAVADTASAVHHTATTDAAWDGPGAVAAMPNEESVLRYCHAWYDADGDPDAKASYRFPHHKTKGGPANLAACRNGLARLENSNIPDGDKTGVRKHLQAHLDDAAKATDDHADGHGDDTAPLDPQAATSEPADTTDGDGWNTAVAHLTAPTDWTALTSHLTESSATGA